MSKFANLKKYFGIVSCDKNMGLKNINRIVETYIKRITTKTNDNGFYSDSVYKNNGTF